VNSIKSKVIFSEIKFGSSQYQEELALRDRILRKPLGLQLSSKDTEDDANQIHVGCFFESKLVACLVLSPVSSFDLKMRQVAVDVPFQSKKIGSSLVEYSEVEAYKKGFRKIILNARLSAIQFYEKLGYKVVGEPHLEVTIPHKYMEKILVDSFQ
jgi:N-acetylglutamate synthase-like GNAT family acetyltransferase